MTVDAELSMLRTFYGRWTELHSIPRDRLHRRQQEVAAQEMVDAHNALKNFYSQHARPKLALVSDDEIDVVAADFDKAAEHG